MATLTETPPPVQPGPPPPDEPQYLTPGLSFRSITQEISGVVLRPTTHPAWLGAFGFSNVLIVMFLVVVIYLLLVGVGIWGINVPLAWAFAITSFVWWIGIGHAGTLISAILLLMHQRWRTSINRIAEAMTIFAVMCAGLFPPAGDSDPGVLPLSDAVYRGAQWTGPGAARCAAEAGRGLPGHGQLRPARGARIGRRQEKDVHFSITPRERTVTSGLYCKRRGRLSKSA
jgi:hypothetical protein